MPRKSKARAAPTIGHMNEGELTAVDRAVGSQVRMRRTLLGMSQSEVSNVMGITFQQLQKYEKGTNRISASKLYQLGMILMVPISFFFEELAATDKGAMGTDVVLSPDVDVSVMKNPLTAKLIRAFYEIESPRKRDAVLSLFRSMPRV
ncbi:MAG: helix-turn-helix transcriptional regulator, partial [Rhodospirillales bacterium]|nr:helix-turn-helix transcriptional regulator [Rhodospirillales bacterium]